jgi:radical SAM superfamily enzyme YgiQ (UPF0313 family)
MKVFFINPTPPASAWPKGGYFPHLVPTEMAQAAATLRQHGHSVRVEERESRLVTEHFDWSRADAIFKTALQEFKPEMIVFHALTPTVEETYRLAKATRETLGSAPFLLMSGQHATALPEQTLRECQAFSAVIIGEMEQTCLEIAERGLSPEITGILLQNTEGIFHHTAPRSVEHNLDLIPPPAWDLFNMEYHTSRNQWMIRWLNLRSINIRTSRGCPNACKFCSAPLTAGAGVRFHSVDYIVDQVQRALSDYAIESVLFEDETLAANEERLHDICEAFRTRGWEKRLKWGCCLRVNQARPELLKMMKSAGCIQVEYGFESATNHLLKAIGKNTTVEQNYAAAKLTREAGLRIFANMMFGLPGETAQDMDRNVHFIRTIRPEVLSATLMAPLPGTSIYHSLEEAQRKTIRWSDLYYLDRPDHDTNLSAMPDAIFFNKYRRLRKYFITPLIQRQMLRDADQGRSPNALYLKKSLRRFRLRHPIHAWRSRL